MDFKELGVAATRSFAFVPGSGQNKAPGCRGNGSGVAFIGPTDLAIALDLFQFGLTDFQFTPTGLDLWFFTIGTLVNVDLEGWLGCCFRLPPAGVVVGKRCQNFQHGFNFVCRKIA